MTDRWTWGGLCLGLLVGWFAARSLPSGPVMNAKQQAPSVETEYPVKNFKKSPVGPPAAFNGASKAGSSLVQGAAMSQGVQSLLEQLAKLKIAEMSRVCAGAEKLYLTNQVSSRAKFIWELPEEERKREIAEWQRRYGEVAGNAMFWKTNFTIEFGKDVLSMDFLLDLEASSDQRNQCVAWIVYFEVNGRPTNNSAVSMSSCEGGGFRKRGDHFFYSFDTYRDPEMGRFVSLILVPMPGAPATAEYLTGETGAWSSLPQFSWQRSSREEVATMQARLQKKMEQAPQ